MGLLDNAKKHFDEQDTRRIEVPEWADSEGKGGIIYAEPLTLAEKGNIKKQTDRRGEIDALIYVLILKARDAQGEPIFTLEDKQALKHKIDPDVIARVVSEILLAPSVGDLLE
jgi:hypothetical protein